MKSGKSTTFSLDEYANAHKDSACKGHFELKVYENRPLTIDAIGAITVPAIPMIACDTCETAYIAPLFRDWIEHIIATQLVQSPYLLTKNQIRFLRLFFDMTQEELAARLGITDKSDISKMESAQWDRVMNPDKQLRMKLFFAKAIGIADIEKIYSLCDKLDESRSAEIDPSQFPTASDVESRLRA